VLLNELPLLYRHFGCTLSPLNIVVRLSDPQRVLLPDAELVVVVAVAEKKKEKKKILRRQ